MSAPRVDLYTAIHKGIRASLYATAQILERANFLDPNERGAAVEATQASLGFLTEHMGHEDTFVEPVVTVHDPNLAREISTEHEAFERTMGAVRRHLDVLAASEGMAAMTSGDALRISFNQMLAEQISHMGVEEGRVMPMLQAKMTDEELSAVRAELQASIPPKRFSEYLELMFGALNQHEVVGMLGGMKAAAPPPVFEANVQIAARVLGARWAAVQAALA